MGMHKEIAKAEQTEEQRVSRFVRGNTVALAIGAAGCGATLAGLVVGEMCGVGPGWPAWVAIFLAAMGPAFAGFYSLRKLVDLKMKRV